LGTETTGKDTGITSSSRVVLDGSLSTFPVLEKAFADFEDGSFDGLDGTLNLDDTLGGLREHLLGSDHTSAGSVLNLLDLETGPADDGTHQVVGDEQTDRGESSDGRRWERRVGQRGLEEETSNLAIGSSDTFDVTGSGEDTVLDSRDDFGNASLDTGSVTDRSDGGTGFTDDDTSFLGADERAESELVLFTAVLEGGFLLLGGDGVWRGVRRKRRWR